MRCIQLKHKTSRLNADDDRVYAAGERLGRIWRNGGGGYGQGDKKRNEMMEEAKKETTAAAAAAFFAALVVPSYQIRKELPTERGLINNACAC